MGCAAHAAARDEEQRMRAAAPELLFCMFAPAGQGPHHMSCQVLVCWAGSMAYILADPVT